MLFHSACETFTRNSAVIFKHDKLVRWLVCRVRSLPCWHMMRALADAQEVRQGVEYGQSFLQHSSAERSISRLHHWKSLQDHQHIPQLRGLASAQPTFPSKNECSSFFTFSIHHPLSYPLKNTARSQVETEPLDKWSYPFACKDTLCCTRYVWNW